MLKAQLILLLSSEFNLLEVLKRGSELSQVGPKRTILLSQLINFTPELVHLVNCSSVALVDIEEDLDAMVLLVEEVDLVLELLHVALIRLLLVLLSKLIDVLSALVKGAQTQNFIVSDLDRLVEAS